MTQTARCAAVAYLNMLPFFADDPEITLYHSPQALNADLAAGRVVAGCSSVIAGLDAGLNIIKPRLGVAAEGDVDSVFIEPIGMDANPESRSVWQRFVTANEGGFKKNILPLEFDPERSTPSVTILSTGASAQSLWIVKSLFLAQGYAVHTRTVDLEVEQMPVRQIHEHVSRLGIWHPAKADDLCCLLMIGDPALERRAALPRERADLNRLDVAALWQSYTGLPCVFALWFTPCAADDELTLRAAERLSQRAQQWTGMDVAEKFRFAARFFKSRNQERLLTLLGHEGICRYLDNLKFDLSDKSYAQSIAVMHELRQRQLSCPVPVLPSQSAAQVGAGKKEPAWFSV